jgi:hypothetical protein
VFIAPLPSNARGADYRKHRFSIAARVRFRRNVFTEQLPSNTCFSSSTVLALGKYATILLDIILMKHYN